MPVFTGMTEVGGGAFQDDWTPTRSGTCSWDDKGPRRPRFRSSGAQHDAGQGGANLGVCHDTADRRLGGAGRGNDAGQRRVTWGHSKSRLR